MDYGDMVMALMHPLVQVYTIPRTGQVAYVELVCNFRHTCIKVSCFSARPPPKANLHV